MKLTNTIQFIVMIGGVIITTVLLPWWCPVIWISLISAVLHIRLKNALLFGTISMGGVWLIMALLQLTYDHSEIVYKTGALLGGMSAVVMVILTTFMGSASGLLAAWFGSRLSSLLKTQT